MQLRVLQSTLLIEILEFRIGGSTIYYAVPYHTILDYASPKLGDLLVGSSRRVWVDG